MQGKFPQLSISPNNPVRARVVSRLSCSEDGDGAGLLPEGLPRRIRILPWGEVPNANGVRLVVGRKLLEAMASPTYAFHTIALDFEHNTVPGSEEYKRTREPRPVAGFGRVVAEEGKGVFLEMERWTPEGAEAAHHYQDVSATPAHDDEGNVVAVVSCALCRNGAVPGAEFLESTLSTTTTPNHTKETEMDYKAIVLKLLGLPEDASDDAVAAALEELNKKTEDGGAERPEGGCDPLSARVEALERRADEAEKQAVLSAARAEGKAVALSADAVAKLSVADLKAAVAATPATVPLAAVTPGAVREKAPAAQPESEEARRVRELCGLSREEVEKWA